MVNCQFEESVIILMRLPWFCTPAGLTCVGDIWYNSLHRSVAILLNTYYAP